MKLRRTGKHARPSPALEAAFRVAPKSAGVALVAGTLIMPYPASLRPTEAAVSISDDGTNWSPWVTYQTGAYEGQC